MIGSRQSCCCCLLLLGLVRCGRWAGWMVSSPPHIDRLRDRRVLSPVKAAAHSRQIMLLQSACRPGDPLLRALSPPYDLEEVGSPPWRSVLRSWLLTLDAMHILSGAMGPCPPATVTALSPTPLLHAVDLPKQASLSSPAATSHPSIHGISTLAWSVSSSACFSFGEGVSDLLGAGPAC